MPKSKSAHSVGDSRGKSTKKVKRATRKQTTASLEKKRWGTQEGGGPGRPKGSTLDKTWKLTPKQMAIARRIIEINNKDGFMPSNITKLAEKAGANRTYVRDLLRRNDFQAYLNHLLLQDGVMLEMSFWRGMQLGLQAGDANVLRLYAQMTGKIAKPEATKLKVELISPDGERFALPTYDDSEIEEAEIVEEYEDEPQTN